MTSPFIEKLAKAAADHFEAEKYTYSDYEEGLIGVDDSVDCPKLVRAILTAAREPAARPCSGAVTPRWYLASHDRHCLGERVNGLRR